MTDDSKGMAMFRLPRARRVLVLAPHPDDEAVGCGGLLAMLAGQGAEIVAVFVTDGGLGPSGRQDAALAKRRVLESRAAAGVLGIRHGIHWGLPDGGLRARDLPVAALAGVIREYDIDLLLTPHAKEPHADHVAVALLPGRLDPAECGLLTVMTYEIWAPLDPNCVVNVSSTMKDKLRAIRAYRSQCQRFRIEHLASGLAQYRAAWSRMRAWRFAECYRTFSLASYCRLCHAD